MMARTAGRHQNTTVWNDAIMSAAYKGLMDAAARWHPDGGASFPTYARMRILHTIQDELRTVNTGRRLDTDIKAQAHLDPGDQTPRYGAHDRRNDVSFNAPHHQLQDMVKTPISWAEIFPDPGADPADVYAAAAATRADVDEVQVMLARLCDRDRRMIRMRYFDRRTLEEIGDAEGVTAPAVFLRLKKIRQRLARLARPA